jgi:small-conductance mechanosensitive channel
VDIQGSQIVGWLTSPAAVGWLRAAVLVVIGAVLIQIAVSSAGRAARTRLTPQATMLARRGVSLLGWSLLAASVLNELGFDLGVLMGAAGVLTVAAGFASQTAASNLISGLFLIGERPFVVGDVITVEGVTGEVTDIDLVSVKLRTFDNLMVRVPNEMLLKSRITNLTHYPIRRFDLQLGVAYKEDVARVVAVLKRVAHDEPLCLDEPEPLIIHQGFGDSAVNLQFSVWADRTQYVPMRTRLQIAIQKAFAAEGIEIPFPQRSLHAGSLSAPLPVRIVPTDDDPAP